MNTLAGHSRPPGDGLTDEPPRLLTGPIAPLPPPRWRRIVHRLRPRTVAHLVYIAAAIFGGCGQTVEARRMTGTATVRDVVVGAVLAPLLLVVLSVTVRIGCAVVGAVSILIEMAVVRIVPALAPVGRTARDIVSGLSVLGVALFVVGGVVGLLLMGWRAL